MQSGPPDLGGSCDRAALKMPMAGGSDMHSNQLGNGAEIIQGDLNGHNGRTSASQGQELVTSTYQNNC
jgi:hypothetical protein